MAHFLAIQRSYLAACDPSDRFVGARAGPRIVVIGESSAVMLGDAMREIARSSAAGFSVANCAATGSGFVHLKRRFDEALAARPDAIVMVFGHNYGFVYAGSPLELWMQELPYRSGLVASFARIPDRPPRSVCEQTAPPVDALARFVRSAAAAALARGVRLVVTTLTPNLMDAPRCDRAAGPLDPRVYQARLLRARGRAAEARDLMAAVAATHSARAEYELGVWLDADGDFPAARASLQAALADDRAPGRVSPAVNDILRAEGRRGGALVRDTQAVMAARQPDGITGWETLADNCHLHRDLFSAEALAVLDLLGVRGLDPRGPEDPEQRASMVLGGLSVDARADRPLPGRPADPLTVPLWRLITRRDPAIQRLIDAWPDRPPVFTPRQRAFWFAGAAEAYRLAGQRERARSYCDRALAASEEVPSAWIARALFDLGEGRADEARRSLLRVVALDPASQEAHAYLRGL
jgi:tetratricopeptide (TPR) repeat protein